ncbi:MAG: TrmB family transcriptional regulator [Anaerolineae bacterium]|nr:TrmB family transcriptional regulator [Anaerolineae bacterium]
MVNDLIDRLTKIGFSEYEAKAYLTLLRQNPATGYQLAKGSGVPRSMIYEVLGKLTSRGAAMTLRVEGGTKYAPVSPQEFFAQLHREHETLITSLEGDLQTLAKVTELDYVWNIEGRDNVLAKIEEMITQAQERVYLALVPAMFPALKDVLAEAVTRDVRVVLYTTEEVDSPGCRVIVAHVSEETLGQVQGLGLVLVVDGEEVLVGEWLAASQARASWTSSPLLVFIAEHHLRTDSYLPQLLAMLGDMALEIIDEEDRELFVRAMDSTIAH